MAKQSKAELKLERCKNLYLEALKAFESEEELRLAALHQPKVSLMNIQHWSAYMQGARKAMLISQVAYIIIGENAEYKEAIECNLELEKRIKEFNESRHWWERKLKV